MEEGKYILVYTSVLSRCIPQYAACDDLLKETHVFIFRSLCAEKKTIHVLISGNLYMIFPIIVWIAGPR